MSGNGDEEFGWRDAIRMFLYDLSKPLMWAAQRLAYVAFRLRGKRGSGVQIHLLGDRSEWRAGD